MKIRLAAAALTMALIGGDAGAQSGYAPLGYGQLPPRHVIAAVRAAGMRALAPPVRSGRNYIVTAVDRYGDVRRVFVDAEFGDIVRMTAARPAGPAYPYVARRAPAYDDDDDLAIRPRTPFGMGPPEYAPPRPRAAVPTRRQAPQANIPNDPGGPDASSAIVPPPPPPSRRTAKPAAPNDATRNAAVSPAGKPTAAKPVGAEQKPTAGPRVILPGGPTPKGEAAAAPKVEAAATPPAPAVGPEKPSAVVPATTSSEIPPAQTLE